MASSMLAIYTDWRIKNGLPKMTRKETYDFVTTSVVDKNTAGFDIESGYGLFVLPSEIPTIKKPEEIPVEVIEPMPVKVHFDAGHGGDDTGAYSGGIREKDLNLLVARRARDILKEYAPSMTRTEDTLIIWNERAALIKDQYDYCMSIHFNAGGGSGVEAIHSAFSERGKQLATFLVNEISSQTGIPKRPTPVFSKKNSAGQDYYYMHRLTGRTTVVIIEVFFLDNDKDKLFMNIEKIAQAIADGFRKFMATQIVFKPPTYMNPRTIRKYNSDVHIFEAKAPMQTRITLGERFKLETVSSIVANELKSGQKVLAGMNCGFFTGANNEHTTLLIANGLYYNPPSINTADFIYYKDGRTEVTNLHGYDAKILSKLQADCHFAIGTSYALVINGKKNLMLAEKFSHSTTKQPRTMIGQKADGTLVLVATDGRVRDSAGLTADEQADLMLELGCINAVNLDGGGSSTMVVVKDGKPVVYNELAEGYQRPVGSVLIVKEA
jgi:exopolysaccharide biosynthesis protein